MDQRSQRLRAAWMYYSHGLTQSDIADQLGISRSTVIRLLDEVRARREVRFWIDDDAEDCADLGIRLEQTLGLKKAVVVPSGDDPETIAKSVGLALGRYLSVAIEDGARVGVGWGRTLTASLDAFNPPRRSGVEVMSLLGGTVDTDAVNPSEFAWRMASALSAKCYLFPAPLIVDRGETRDALIENCGLGRLFEMAQALDVAVVSVGDITPQATSLSRDLISKAELETLVDAGIVADVMCHFLNANGETVNHPLKDRVMAVDPDVVATAKNRVIASGGAHRARAIQAVVKRINCTTLITDEAAAFEILKRSEN